MRKIAYIPLTNEPERYVDYSTYKDLFGYDNSYKFYGAFYKGQQVGYGAAKDGEIIHIASLDPEVDQGLNAFMHTYEGSVILAASKNKGKDPKDLINAPIPFIYDIHKKHIQIGYEGEKTRDIKPYRGEFSPGALVEGEYQPGGKMIIYPSNTALYTTRQITNTWVKQFPQMEVTGIEIEHEGKTHKVATIEDEWTIISENYNNDSNIWDSPQETSSTEFKPQEGITNTGLIVPTSLLSHYKTHTKQSMAADPDWLNSWIAQNGPYAYHSFSNPNIAEGITKNGLLPWDHPQNPTISQYAGGPYEPRKNHVYLELPSIAADPHTGQLSKQLMYRNPYVAQIDLTKLDPNNINADEDSSATLPAPAGLGNKALWSIPDRPYNSYGEFADSRPETSNFPLNVQRSIERNNTIAHHGVIPPEALKVMKYQDAFPSNQRESSMDAGQFVRVLASADPAASAAKEALTFAGGKVYAVGGAVRDVLRGENPKDIDLMVSGLPAEEVDNILSKLPGRVDLTGKRFGVYRYRHDGHEVEIALPRQDKYETARRGEGVITVDHNLPLEKDLQRRDFTVNSMAVDLQCYSEDTEVLTEIGWLGLDDLLVYENENNLLPKVATLDFATDTLVYQSPINNKVHWKHHEGEMVSFTNKVQDILVTPNHRMYVAPLPRTKGAIKQSGPAEVTNENVRVVYAEEISVKDKYAVRVGAKLEDRPTRDKFTIPEYQSRHARGFGSRRQSIERQTLVNKLREEGYTYNQIKNEYNIPLATIHKDLHPGYGIMPSEEYTMQPAVELDMNAWLAWLGWYIAEGSVSDMGAILIPQSVDSPNLENLQRACRELGWPGVEFVDYRSERSNQCDLWYWRANKPIQLAVWLKEHVGSGARNKRIPSFVFDLSPEQQRILMRGMIAGDGRTVERWEIDQSCSYGTASIDLANDFHRLALHCGFRCSMVHTQTRQERPFYRINLLPEIFYRPAKSLGTVVQLATPKRVPYQGRVFCLTLPNGNFVTRRNGFIAIQGNSGEIIDPYGGREDLEKNLLRTTHPDSFREDPTRLVRALTAHSRFGLHPDETTRSEMASNAHLLRGESPDALNKQLDKLMGSHNPAAAIRLAHETGVLKHLFPELDENWDFDQKSKYHNHTLGDHTMHVLGNVSQLTSDPDVRMAALLHDVGKPASAWQDPETGNNHFYEKHMPDGTTLGANHEQVGAQIAENRLKAFNYPVARIKRVTHLVANHMFNPGTSDHWGRKFINKVGDEHVDDLLNLREADQGGKGMVGHSNDVTADAMRETIDRVRKGQQPTDLSNLAISGNDLLQLPGMQQGPEIGRVLRLLLDHVLQVPTDNNYAKLMELAKGYIR